MTLTQILQKIKSVFYTKSEIDSMGGGSSLDATIKAKAEDSNVVHKSGNESIGGVKTFSTGIVAHSINEPTNTSAMYIYGGTNWQDGCRLELSGSNRSDWFKGCIDLIALNPNSSGGYDQSNVCLDPYGNFYPYYFTSNANLGTSTNKWKTINGLEPSQLSLPNGSSCISITPSYTIGDYITMTASGFLRIQAENTDYELVMDNNDGTIVCSIKKLGCKLMIVPVVKGQQFRVTQCEGAYGVYLRLLPSQGNI